MKNQIQRYIDIANYTDHMGMAEKLKRMQDMLENGSYLLAFMGEFSSGKSRLINNLLGKDVLPVHVRETTALITYIQYGETDHVELVGLDGSVSECDFEDVINLWQSGDSAGRISSLDCIRLFVSSDLLRNGMIIADTPGINTVLQPHVDKTVKLLESANRVIYVMGGSMTSVDRDFVNVIHKNGIDTIMVRSKMDNLSSSDENVDKTIRKEKDELSEFTSDPVFFLSNEKDSKFFSVVSELKTYLLNNVASGLKTNLEKAVASKLSLYTDKLKKLLNERENSINMLLNSNDASYKEEKRKSERKLYQLNNTISDNQKILRNNFEQAKSSAMRKAKQTKDKNVETAKKWIEEQDYSNENFSISTFCDELEKRLKRDCCEIQNKYAASFDKVTGDNVEKLQEKFISNGLYFDTAPPATLDEAEELMQEYQERAAALNTLKESLEDKIKECESKITDEEDKLSEASQQVRILEDAMNDVKGQLSVLESYVPRYIIQEGTHSNERKMAAIGKTADIASILIPGEAWAQGAALLFKGIKGVEISVETAKGLDLAIDGVRMIHNLKKSSMDSNGVPAIEMNDEWNNTEYVGEEGRRILESQLQSRESAPNLLDFLSIEYYFKKIGKKMDKPDQVVEDPKYKADYDEKKTKLNNDAKAAAFAAAEERIRLLRIKDEAEKSKEHKKALEHELAKINPDLSELEQKYKKKRKEVLNSNYCNYYTNFVSDSLSAFVESLKTDVLPSIETKIAAYLDTYCLPVQEDINRQNEALNELEKKFNGEGKDALKDELTKCRELMSSLENEGKQLCTV